MSGYSGLVIATTGCQEASAAWIEEMMRVERPTLDALDRRQFAELARTAYAATVELATTGELADIAAAYGFDVPPEFSRK